MTHYETLGVSPDASHEEIQSAYRRAVMRCHPDREGGDEETFKRVQRAGEVLLDAAARAEYDRTGRDANEPPSVLERVQAMLADALDKTSVGDFVEGLQGMNAGLQLDVDTIQQELEHHKNLLLRHELSVARLSEGAKGLRTVAAMREALIRKKLQGIETTLEMLRAAIELLKELPPAPPPSPVKSETTITYDPAQDLKFWGIWEP